MFVLEIYSSAHLCCYSDVVISYVAAETMYCQQLGSGSQNPVLYILKT